MDSSNIQVIAQPPPGLKDLASENDNKSDVDNKSDLSSNDEGSNTSSDEEARKLRQTKTQTRHPTVKRTACPLTRIAIRYVE